MRDLFLIGQWSSLTHHRHHTLGLISSLLSFSSLDLLTSLLLSPLSLAPTQLAASIYFPSCFLLFSPLLIPHMVFIVETEQEISVLDAVEAVPPVPDVGPAPRSGCSLRSRDDRITVGAPHPPQVSSYSSTNMWSNYRPAASQAIIKFFIHLMQSSLL